MKKSKQRKADRRLSPVHTEQLQAVSGGNEAVSGGNKSVVVLVVGSKVK